MQRDDANGRPLRPTPPPRYCPECAETYRRWGLGAARLDAVCGVCRYDARGEVIFAQAPPGPLAWLVGLPATLIGGTAAIVGAFYVSASIRQPLQSLLLLAVGMFCFWVAVRIIRQLPRRRRPIWRFRPDGLAIQTGSGPAHWQPWPAKARLDVHIARPEFRCRPQLTLMLMTAGEDATDPELAEVIQGSISLRARRADLRGLALVNRWMSAAACREATPEEIADLLHRPLACLKCGYLLRGLDRPVRCPECGWTTREEGGVEAIILRGAAGQEWSITAARTGSRPRQWLLAAGETGKGLAMVALVGAAGWAVVSLLRVLPELIRQAACGLMVVGVALLLAMGIFQRAFRKWLAQDEQPTPAAGAVEEPDPEALAAVDASGGMLYLTRDGFLQTSGHAPEAPRPWSEAAMWRIRPWFGRVRITAVNAGAPRRTLLGRRRHRRRRRGDTWRPVDFICDLPAKGVEVVRKRVRGTG